MINFGSYFWGFVVGIAGAFWELSKALIKKIMIL
jgi:hypothetical protein